MPIDLYLTAKWPATKNSILHGFLLRSDALLAKLKGRHEIDSETRAALKRELDGIISECIGRRCQQAMADVGASPERRALWQAANQVCPISDALIAEFKMDKAVRGLSEKTEQRLALSQLLKAHLYRRRQEALKGWDNGHTGEYEARVWSALNEISNELIASRFRAQGGLAPEGYRCSLEHAEEVKIWIAANKPNDEYLPRGLDTIVGYFLENCPECAAPFEVDVVTSEGEKVVRLEATQIDWNWRQAQLRSPPMQEIILGLRPILADCIKSLDGLQVAVLENEGFLQANRSNVVSLQTGKSRIEDFCARHGFDCKRYDEVLKETMSQLGTCLKTKARKEWAS